MAREVLHVTMYSGHIIEVEAQYHPQGGRDTDNRAVLNELMAAIEQSALVERIRIVVTA